MDVVAATEAMLHAELLGRESLSAALGAEVPAQWPPELYERDDLERALARIVERGDPAEWGLHYVVRRGDARTPAQVVGVAGYKGPPDASGSVEIGYALVAEARGSGYATEAVLGLAGRAFGDPRVERVTAETLPHLTPSIRVLQRAGFTLVGGGPEPGVIRFALDRRPARRPSAGDGPALPSLGWDGEWTCRYAEATEGMGTSLAPARVVAEHRARWTVATADGDRSAVAAGRLRHEAASHAALPAVGDWVVVAHEGGDGTTTIHRVLERRGAFARKVAGDTTAPQVVAANVDIAFVATALPGDLNVRRLERYLTLAWESGATPVVVLTKADLSDDVAGAVAEAAVAAPGVDVLAISGTTGAGLDALARYLVPGRTAVLLGSSGVGKSTLVNRLLGADRLRTAAVRDDGRGRHTTTHRELIRLANGALLIDTPGMRELQLWSADSGLEAAFADVEALAAGCRFRDCRHESEPECAVRAAVEAGTLGADRLEHWHTLARELAHLARKQDELLAAEHRGRVKSLTQLGRKRIRDKYGR